MNRRNFLRAFVAIAAAPAIELLPVAAADDLVGIPVIGDSMTPAAPTIFFRTSAGEIAFATTPEMWEITPTTARLVGGLSWTVDQTMTLEAVGVEFPGVGRKMIPVSTYPAREGFVVLNPQMTAGMTMHALSFGFQVTNGQFIIEPLAQPA